MPEKKEQIASADGLFDQASKWGGGILDVGKGVLNEIRYATGHKRPTPTVEVAATPAPAAQPAVRLAAPAPQITNVLHPASSGTSTTMMTPGAYPPVSYKEYKGIKTTDAYKDADAVYRKDQNALDAMQTDIMTESAPQIIEQNNLLIEEIKQNFDQMTEDAKFQRRSLADAFSDASAGRKVMAAIGIAFGALGSGLTGKENQALAVIEKNLDNEYKSRKDRLNNLMTIAEKRQGGIYKQAQMQKLIADNLTALEFGDMEAKVIAQAAAMGAKTGNTKVQQLLELAMQSRVSKRAMESIAKYNQQETQRTYDEKMTDRMMDEPKVISVERKEDKNPSLMPGRAASNKIISDKVVKEISDFDNAIQKAEAAVQALGANTNWVGRIDGAIPDDFIGGDQVAFRAAIGRMLDAYRVMTTGAGANMKEITKLETRLPKTTDTHDNFMAKAKGYIEEVKRFKQIYVNNLKKAGKNVEGFEASSPAPHGQRVKQDGKFYEWNGSEYIEVQ